MPSGQTDNGTVPIPIITTLLLLTLVVIIALAIMLRNIQGRPQRGSAEDPEQVDQDESRSLPSQILESIPVVAYEGRVMQHISVDGKGETLTFEAGGTTDFVAGLDSGSNIATSALQPLPIARNCGTKSAKVSNDQSPSCCICTDDIQKGQSVCVCVSI